MSKKKSKPLNILIIDDDASYVNDSLRAKARPYRIKFVHYDNLEAAKEFLVSSKGRYIAGVILDVLCLKTKAQEVPDKSFITEALRYFDTKHPKLPKVVLTGEPDEYRSLKDFYQGTYEIFDKSTGEDNLLKYLSNESMKLEHIRFAHDFSDVFEVFEKEYLEAEFLDDIIKCLRDMSNPDSPAIKRTLGSIRRIQESIYQAINKVDQNIVPTDNIAQGTKVRAILKHLYENGHTEQRGIINQFTWPMYQITSDFGSHTTVENPDYWATKYTVQSLVFTLFDLLLWFKGIMNKANQGTNN